MPNDVQRLRGELTDSREPGDNVWSIADEAITMLEEVERELATPPIADMPHRITKILNK